jgi:hypothetical protein
VQEADETPRIAFEAVREVQLGVLTTQQHNAPIASVCKRGSKWLYNALANARPEALLLCCAVLCCAVLCCAVLCCAVLCCAVLCCAVLCCAVVGGCRKVLFPWTDERLGNCRWVDQCNNTLRCK